MTDALRVEGLAKSYGNGVNALKGVDLSVSEADFFALLGPNGAGKSTLISIVSSLVNKTGGRVSVFGEDLDRNPRAVRAAIGLVPQEFNFNIWEPVEEIVINQAGYFGIPRARAREAARKHLTALGLWEKRREQASTLSGGMKRRLMIARALVHDPRLLILDEPTAGVDIEIRRSMWQFLRELNEHFGTTVILTTHYLEEAENLCRRIAIIDHGAIIENTTMRSLLGRLKRETFVLYLRDPLNELPVVAEMEIRQQDETTLEVDLVAGQSLSRLFEVLSAVGVEVMSLRNKRNRLEELFMRLVQDGNGILARDRIAGDPEVV